MRFQPKFVPASPESPMRGFVTTALRSNLGYTTNGVGRQSDITQKVRAGERHPMLATDRVMVESRQRGATAEWAFNVVRAFRQSVATIWGMLPNVSDPTAAHIAETDAECASNKLEARVFTNVAAASESDLEALMTAKEVEIQNDEYVILVCAGELLRRETTRKNAMRRLTLA